MARDDGLVKVVQRIVVVAQTRARDGAIGVGIGKDGILLDGDKCDGCDVGRSGISGYVVARVVDGCCGYAIVEGRF